MIENHNKLYTAIIIEPRKHKALEFVLHNFTSNLDNNIWNFVIYCSNFNKDYVLNIKTKLNININIIPISDSNITIKDYNFILTNKKFYDLIPTDIFLIFQTDSMILNKEQINNFLQYDYVGAPWKNEKTCGNGGLSLRRKTKMIEIINKKEYNYLQNEDFYFSFNNNINLNKPDFELSKTFSVEQCYCENSFGIHKVWKSLPKNEYEQLIKIYPDIDILRNLQ